jgi:hypothetical protein
MTGGLPFGLSRSAKSLHSANQYYVDFRVHIDSPEHLHIDLHEAEKKTIRQQITPTKQGGLTIDLNTRKTCESLWVSRASQLSHRSLAQYAQRNHSP